MGIKEGKLLSQCDPRFVAYNHLGAELNLVITVLCKPLKRLKIIILSNHSSQKIHHEEVLGNRENKHFWESIWQVHMHSNTCMHTCTIKCKLL